jgi:uncharacterized membrane protein
VRTRGATLAAGILLGTGLGGFVDGIVLHQLLQWHSMLSGWIPPTDLVAMKVNMVWDGIFHAFTWLVTVAGLAVLWRARAGLGAVATSLLVGAMLAGWGLFNVVEGTVDHLLLGVHHVHPGEDQLAWDIGFLVVGGLQLLAGALLVGGARRGVARRPAEA